MKFWIIFQIFSSIGVCFGNLILGTAIGYPATALPQLEIDETLNLDEQSLSWFAPTFHICAAMFMIIGGIISSKIGRRRVHLISIPFIIMGYVLMGLAQNKTMLFAGRILSCAFVCIYMPSTGAYISETVHPDIRGSLLTLPPFFLSAGYMYTWIIGYFWYILHVI